MGVFKGQAFIDEVFPYPEGKSFFSFDVVILVFFELIKHC